MSDQNPTSDGVDTYDPDSATRTLLTTAEAEAEFDDAQETRRALAKTAPTAGSSKRSMIRIWYNDGTCSKGVNPNRPAALLVFEAEYGHAEPRGVRELMWLVWHMLGRPGPGGTVHREGADAKSAYDDWFVSVDELEQYEEERGKAGA